MIDHAKDFAQLTAQEATPVEAQPGAQNPGMAPLLGPITSDLRGALAASGAPGKTVAGEPGREDYRAYLDEKFR